MNIEELENKVKAFQNEIVKLQEEIEKLKCKKENKKWRAKNNETYYFLNDANSVCKGEEIGLTATEIHFKTHNYFKTKEEAQAVADNIKTHIELMELAEELNTEPIDWRKDVQKKYFIKYNYNFEEIATSFYIWVKFANIIYCTNENFKDEAIKRIGEERLIKYLKGV